MAVGYLLVLFGLVAPVVSGGFTYRFTLVAGFGCDVHVCWLGECCVYALIVLVFGSLTLVSFYVVVVNFVVSF